MNRIIYISSFMLFMAITVRAQLIFSNNKKMAIGTDTVVFEPSLMVGNHNFFGTSANASIGTAATPKVNSSTNNIGVYGGFGISTNLSQNSNYGNKITGAVLAGSRGRFY